jgi:hypothetical protein
MPSNPIESINNALTESERLCAGATRYIVKESPFGIGSEGPRIFEVWHERGTDYKRLMAETRDFETAREVAKALSARPNETAALRCAVEALREIEALTTKSENELYSVNTGERLATLTIKCRDIASAALAKIAAILERKQPYETSETETLPRVVRCG